MSDFSQFSNLNSLPNASRPLTAVAVAASSDRDDAEWQTLKTSLKKLGFNDAILQAMESDCPSYEVLQAFIAWTEQHKRHETALSIALADCKKQLENVKQELKEASSFRDTDNDVILKRLQAAQAEIADARQRADKWESTLKKEIEEKQRYQRELMELRAGGDLQALTDINKTLADSQTQLKRDVSAKELKIGELRREIETIKAERDRVLLDVKSAQDQSAQWKANCDEIRHSFRIQIEALKRDHERALNELSSQRAQQPSTQLTAEQNEAEQSAVEKLKKMEEILRLQRQVSAKFQEQNEALREELNSKKTEVTNLSEDKLKLQQKLDDALALAMNSSKIASPISSPKAEPQVPSVKLEEKDAVRHHRSSYASPSKSVDVGGKSSAIEASIMTKEEIDMMSDINDVSALKAINAQLCQKISDRTTRYFEMRKELQDCQSCYTSICKQLQEAKNQLDQKEELIIVYRRRLRHLGQELIIETSASPVIASAGVRRPHDLQMAPPSARADSTGLHNHGSVSPEGSDHGSGSISQGEPSAKHYRRTSSQNLHQTSSLPNSLRNLPDNFPPKRRAVHSPPPVSPSSSTSSKHQLRQ